MKFFVLALLAYCLWNAQELFSSWQTSPLERYSGILLFLWVTPILIYPFASRLQKKDDRLFHPFLLWSALLISFFGVIGSLNTLNYIALALVFTAFVPWSWEIIPWGATALLWMPAFGWFGARYAPDIFMALRFIGVLGGITLWILGRMRRE